MRLAARSVTQQPAGIFAAALGLVLCLTGVQTQATTVAYWRFEPGNLATDSSGNTNDLTINSLASSTEIATNAPGTGSVFCNGTNAFALATAGVDLSPYKTLTLECFVKTTQTSLGMAYSTADPNTSPGGFYFDFNEVAGRVKVATRSSGWTYKTTAYPADGGWHHYAATIDQRGANTAVNIYIDGVLKSAASSAAAAARSFLNGPFFLGCFANTNYLLNGLLDEVRVSSMILPPSGFLIAPLLTNAAIIVTQPPTNTTVLQNRSAVFAVAATLTNGDPALLEYQWQRGGTNLQGATASSYTIPAATLTDNDAQFTVTVSVQCISNVTGGTVTNVIPVTCPVAILTVEPDVVPAHAVSTFALVSTTVGVRFDEPVDVAYANNPALYSLDQPNTWVNSAQLQADGLTVMLDVSGLTSPQYALTCSGVADLAGNLGTNTVSGTNAGLAFADIGRVDWTGLLLYSDASQYTVMAGGYDTAAVDGENLLYQTFSGDFDLRVQLDSMVNAGLWSVGGVEVRESLDPASRHISAATYYAANNYWSAYQRAATGGATTTIPNGYVAREAGFAFPNAWLRITRLGQTFTCYHSTNGVDWVQLGDSVLPDPAYPDEVSIGIVSCEKTRLYNRRGNFIYSNFSVVAPPPPTNAVIVITQPPTNTTVLENHPAAFTVSATLSNGNPVLLRYQWKLNDTDIPGAVSSSYSLDQVSLGDGGSRYSVVVFVSGAPYITPVTTADATLTVLPDTGPPQAISTFALVPTVVGVRFDEKVGAGSANNPGLYSLDQPGATVDVATLQSDGRTVMLGVSGLTNAQYALTYTGIADLAGNLGTNTVSGTNAGLAFADIGWMIQPSSLFYSDPSQYSVMTSGYNQTTVDSENLLYQAVTGDFDVRVRLDGMADQNSPSIGGVEVRETLDEASRHISAGTYGWNASGAWRAFQRASTGGATVTVSNGEQPREAGSAYPNAWLRITRYGQTFTCYHSTNGVNWSQLGDSVLPDPVYPDQVLVGMGSCAMTWQGNSLVTTFTYSSFSLNSYVVVPPLLQIHLVGTNAVVSWPSNALDFTLQQASNLVAGSWTTVTSYPMLTGDRWQVTVPAGPNVRFYRLRH